MNTIKNPPSIRILFTLFSLLFSSGLSLAQGSLAPPGAPAPTMKTLQQIEPRVPIPSLPLTITNSGSYYITTNLTGVSGTNGITIVAGNVALDLGGFTLEGVPGSSNGISIGAVTNVTVRNGTLSDWGQTGIFADPLNGGNFSQLNIVNSGSDGLDPGYGALLSHCIVAGGLGNGFGGICPSCTFDTCAANKNSFSGYSTYDGCLFVNCAAHANGLDGFNPYFDCTMKDCNATDSGFDGFDTPYVGCMVAHCVSDNNGSQGIYVGDECTVRDCVAYDNTLDGIIAGNGCVIESCASSVNQGAGISTSNACSVINCVAYTNSQNGISVSANCQIKNCTAAYNGTGISATNDCTISDCNAGNNLTNGIMVDHSCLIENNTCQSNGGGNSVDGGIHCLGSFNRIDGNHLTDNNGNGIRLDAGGNTVTRNSAKNNPTNYFVGSGNDVGPIGTAATSTSPWANLQ